MNQPMESYRGAETLLVDEWLDTALAADPVVAALAVGGIHDAYVVRPQKVNEDDPDVELRWPAVIWDLSTTHDVRGAGTHRILVDCTYLVKVTSPVTPGKGYRPLGPLAAAIDRVLTGSGNGVVADMPGGYIVTCVRTEQFRDKNVDEGQEFRYLGGYYRVQVQAR